MSDAHPDDEPSAEFRSELNRRVGIGAALLLSGTATVSLVRLLVIGILARLLVPADFGLIGAAGILIAFVDIFATSGIALSLVQRRQIQRRHTRTALTVNLMTGSVAGWVVWQFAPNIAHFFAMERLGEILPALAILFPMTATSAVLAKLLEREMQFRRLMLSDVLAYTVGYAAVSVPLALAGFGVWSLVTALLGAEAVRLLVLAIAQQQALRLGFDRRSYRDLMRTGLGYGVARYVNYVAMKGDYFVVGRALGVTALGTYERTYVMMEIVANLLTKTMNTVLFPAFSRVQDDRRRLFSALDRGTALLMLVFAPVSGLCVVLAPEIISLLLGGGWHQAVLPFRILATAMFFRSAYKLSGLIVNGVGAVWGFAAVQVFYASGVVGGAYLLVSHGIVGVAVSTVLSVILTYFLLTGLALRRIEGSWRRLMMNWIPAIFYGSIASSSGWIIADQMRAIDCRPISIAIVASTAAACLLLAVAYSFPRTLGRHGMWAKDVVERNGRLAISKFIAH